MKLRKLLCLVLLLTVVVVLAACGTKASKHTVTFDSNGGSAVASQVVKSGDPAFAPEDPTRAGYIFLGWYKGNNKWDFSKPVTANMTLVAEWKADPNQCAHVDSNRDNACDNCGISISMNFTITYRDGWKTMSGLRPTSYTTSDGKLKLPTPKQKDYYEFAGWYKDDDLTEVATEIDTSLATNLIFYAKFVPITYTATYNLNGGTNADSNPTSFTANDLGITLADPTREGYIFRGWFLDNTFTQPITELTKNDIPKDKTANITLYARWASPEDQFTVTYHDDAGNVLFAETLYKSDSDQTLRPYTDFPALNVEGYSFLAWVDSLGSDAKTVLSIPAGTSDDVNVYASLKNEATHNILYYVDGEYYASGAFYEVDGLNELLDPTKGGYVFDGWYTNRNFTGDKVTSIPTHTKEDVKLYGRFVPHTYSITYEIDGAIVDLGLGQYSTSDEKTALPEIPAKAGYVILGWYTADGRLMEENSIAAGSFGDLELHAVYEKVSYRITYYLNGGTNSADNVTEYRHDEIPTLHDPLGKSGYKFAGWFTDPTFSGTAIEDLTAYANQDISLFALWIPDTESNNDTTTPEVPF